MSFHPPYAVRGGRVCPPADPTMPAKKKADVPSNALEVASRFFTAQEYQVLVDELASGRVDVRFYDEALVLTWNH